MPKYALNINGRSQRSILQEDASVAHHQAAGKLAHSVDEFCSLTGLGRSFLYEEIRAGRLRAIKKGRRTLILDEDGRAYLRS